jgi:Tfp pilus assembly protein PilX
MPRQERGTVLIIALIILVAMTLAGIATMRSVDTASLMAGNIAFRQATVNSADQGIQTAYAWLLGSLGGSLNADAAASGYFSNVPQTEPDWSDPANWTGAKKLNSGDPDASGNVVSFIIHRMCTVSNCAAGDRCFGVDNLCASTPDASSTKPEGQDHFRPTDRVFSFAPSIHYRITARAEGPRNSVSVVQVMLRAY